MGPAVFYDEGIYIGYKYYETRYYDYIMGQGNPGDRGMGVAGGGEEIVPRLQDVGLGVHVVIGAST